MEEITVGPTPVEIKRAEHNSGIHPKLVMVPAPELRQKCEPININLYHRFRNLCRCSMMCYGPVLMPGYITSSISAATGWHQVSVLYY